MPNLKEMREMLWEDIQKLREGKTSAANCNAVTNAVGKILSMIKVDFEFCRMTGKAPDNQLFLPSPSVKPSVTVDAQIPPTPKAIK